MNPHWSHVALNCRDQQATEDSYSKWLGFERARIVPLGEEQIVFLRQGGCLPRAFPYHRRRDP